MALLLLTITFNQPSKIPEQLLTIIITNLTLNYEDSRITLNRGLTVSPNGLGLTTRSKGGSKFGDTIDSKAAVK